MKKKIRKMPSGQSSDVKRVNRRKRKQALDFTDRVRPDGTMQGDGPLAP